MSPRATEEDMIEVVLVESDGCHLCEQAGSTLEAIAPLYRLQVRRVDLSSDEGRAIMRTHRAPMPPIVLIGGELLGWGRLSGGKLRRRLEQLESSKVR